MQNLDEILLRKHCKKRASIITHFLPYKKSKKKKNRKKNPQNMRIYMKKA
jgi:hypothetical protein